MTQEELQQRIVDRVLEEMSISENILMSWNAFWYEKYMNAVLDEDYFYGWYDKIDTKEDSKIDLHTSTSEYNGIPLKSIKLNDKITCDVSTIYWYNIKTNNSTRSMTFKNDGNIYLEKDLHSRKNKKHKEIGYEAKYNVLSNDFDLSITEYDIDNSKFNDYLYSLSNNCLIEKDDNLEVVSNINSNTKLVRIKKVIDDKVYSFIFNIVDNKVKTVMINTHKGKGKVRKINGTYRFDINENSISSSFCSRKGVKTDIKDKNELVNILNIILSDTFDSNKSEDIIIAKIINPIRKYFISNIFDFESIDLSDINVLEKKLFDMLKCIKGELPIKGLTDSINNCLELVNQEQSMKLIKKPTL